jgi:predicted aminopeptidase
MSATREKTWIVLAFLLPLGGCESIGYYAHVTGGQLALLNARQPVEEVIAGLGESEDGALKARLISSQQILEFAERELGLPVGDRYRSYVDLGREAAVWNLFAAPSLSLEAHTWCYPFVGCAPYRGYFAREKAEDYRARLEADGLETYLGTVSAYSTLGWFDDPLLSTFIDMPETDFIELIFHELAHSKVWVKGDATFNESFASFVGRQGLEAWLLAQGQSELFEQHLAREEGWAAAVDLLMLARTHLEDVYGSNADDAGKLALKKRTLDATANCLKAHAAKSGNPGFGRLVKRLNNAYLASLATYSDFVGVFEQIFQEEDGDWERFYARVAALGELDGDARTRLLDESAQEQVAATGDDDRTDQIQCEALTSHGLDGEVPGAVDDDVGGSRHR